MTDYTTITACGECCVRCSKKIDGSCPGCIEADGRVPEWAGSGMCKVRACRKEHNARFCGLCTEFPCEKLPKLISWNPRIVQHLSALRDEYIIKYSICETNRYIVCGHTHYKLETKFENTFIWNPGSVGASCDVPFSYRFMVIHDNNGKWEPEFITLEADTEQIVEEMRESGLYEIAPYWTRFTELLVTGKSGRNTHGSMLNHAMEICLEKNGECNWPMIPEECYQEAYKEILNEYKSNDICREMRYNLLVTRDNKMTVQTSKSIVDTFKPFRNELLNEPETTINT